MGTAVLFDSRVIYYPGTYAEEHGVIDKRDHFTNFDLFSAFDRNGAKTYRKILVLLSEIDKKEVYPVKAEYV
ncbi:MAG TPA: hypothetical protein VMW93_05240, partial [bacterium]|nr:hypothetical protein [bacterium]